MSGPGQNLSPPGSDANLNHMRSTLGQQDQQKPGMESESGVPFGNEMKSTSAASFLSVLQSLNVANPSSLLDSMPQGLLSMFDRAGTIDPAGALKNTLANMDKPFGEVEGGLTTESGMLSEGPIKGLESAANQQADPSDSLPSNTPGSETADQLTQMSDSMHQAYGGGDQHARSQESAKGAERDTNPNPSREANPNAGKANPDSHVGRHAEQQRNNQQQDRGGTIHF